MTVVENYFKGRYIQRLDEFSQAIMELAVDESLSKEEYSEQFTKIYNQFVSTTELHLKNFKNNKATIEHSDMKLAKFTSKDWLISLLCGNTTSQEIMES